MSFVMLEYACRTCGVRCESLEPRSAPTLTLSHPPCGCDSSADRVLSAVAFKPQYGAVTTGKNGPPPQHALDTRPMADGVPMGEWRKASRAKRREVIRRYGP